MTEKDFTELRNIVDELELKAQNARSHFDYLRTSMIEDWVDQIKNCEVGLKEAKQMLKAANMKF